MVQLRTARTLARKWWIDPTRHDDPPADPPADPPTDPPADPDPGDDDESALPDTVKAILKKERDARKAADRRAKAGEKALEQLQAIEDEKKTEAQKLTDRAETAERETTDLERKLLRQDIAIAKGLPAELVDRLQGDDREALEADADALLLLLLPPKTPPAPGPTPGQQTGRVGVGTRCAPPADTALPRASGAIPRSP